MKQASLAAIGLVSGMVVGCGSGRQTLAETPALPTESVHVDQARSKEATDVSSKGQIVIADDIRKACGISDQDAYFAFDSAVIRGQDTGVLQQVATCFNTGPLHARLMRVVGHADPRGDDEYNMVLGGRRADSVRQYIEQAGLGSSQMETSSRGSIDATGHNEDTWAKDRRVDLMLAN